MFICPLPLKIQSKSWRRKNKGELTSGDEALGLGQT